MALFFAFSLFTSAALLFSVQPMVARILLPFLGGTPAVWNVCLVFFQATLLAGYAYAHLLTTRFPVPTQKAVHLALMLVTCAALPIGYSAAAARNGPGDSEPFLWLARILFSVIALPFFTVSSSAPLLQSWFSHTRHRSSRDPYFLYAASNLGSVIGLLAYPAVIEPRFSLPEQGRLWKFGYILLLLLFAGCALMTGKNSNASKGADSSGPSSSGAGSAPARVEIGWSPRLRWMALAFVPSSLMLGVTNYFTTDIASVPLLWTVPLAMYLVTYILAFQRRRIFPRKWLARMLPINAVALVFVMLAKSHELAWLQMGIHMAFFFCAALSWHTRLADERPASIRLTEFYFCVSAGGVLGGLFNALLAPVLFRTMLEYPLMIVLACIRWLEPENAESVVSGVVEHCSAYGRSGRSHAPPLRGPARLFSEFLRLRTSRAPLLGGFGPELVWSVGIGFLTAGLAWIVPRFGLEPHLRTMAIFGLPLVLCYVVSKHERTLPLALAVGAVLVGSHVYTASQGHTLRTERNFFGTLRVALDPSGRIYCLYHGTTLHGMQFLDPNRQMEPLAYYYAGGPCGQALNAFNSGRTPTNVAVIGLGAGVMAGYAQTGQHWTFYEIDPAVIRLAAEGEYFTYLRRCTNAAVDLKSGDARLRLREATPGYFDLLVCDAFGSDAPPLHLLNSEAMELYLSKLSEHGVLLFHISSRYLDFQPVLGNLADHFQLQALVGSEDELSEQMLREGKLPSTWVAMARRAEDLGPLTRDPGWHALPPAPSMRLWTDDYSNILGIFQWE